MSFDAEPGRFRKTRWALAAVFVLGLAGLAFAASRREYPLVVPLLLVVLGAGAAVSALGPVLGTRQRLTVDDGGLMVEAGLWSTRLSWKQIAQVRIIDRPLPPGVRSTPVVRTRLARRRAGANGWVVVWLAPDVEPPAARMHLPSWHARLGGVRICDLATLDTTDERVAEALRTFGGELYDPGRGPR
ncbi:hypothetical protein AB0M43_07110 [Longispora sp. NPDC051575]|uniref:hypothetical protein n=1 Tax=Longispora sp. NPDC051575 TaxID=3154943 RepID=UPI003448FA09